MSIQPVRLQRSRKKGSRLVSPNGLPIVCVTRPGKYGNPFKVGGYFRKGDIDPRARFQFVWTQSYKPDPRFTLIETAAEAVEWFRWYASVSKPIQNAIAELRGKNVACFCALDQPCHADVILELANK